MTEEKTKLTKVLTIDGMGEPPVRSIHTKPVWSLFGIRTFNEQWYGWGRPYGPTVPNFSAKQQVNRRINGQWYGGVPPYRATVPTPKQVYFERKNIRKMKTRTATAKTQSKLFW